MTRGSRPLADVCPDCGRLYGVHALKCRQRIRKTPVKRKARTPEDVEKLMKGVNEPCLLAERRGTTTEHVHGGNCWESIQNRESEDVCVTHEEPRGECSVCPPCLACAAVFR
jgi:hypothetical protein